VNGAAPPATYPPTCSTVPAALERTDEALTATKALGAHVYQLAAELCWLERALGDIAEFLRERRRIHLARERRRVRARAINNPYSREDTHV